MYIWKLQSWQKKNLCYNLNREFMWVLLMVKVVFEKWGDERTFSFCFDGIEENKTVAVGTHGCIKRKEDKIFFKIGLAQMVQRLLPKTIIVYGRAPDDIFKPYKDMGINIIVFESQFSKSRKQVDVWWAVVYQGISATPKAAVWIH